MPRSAVSFNVLLSLLFLVGCGGGDDSDTDNPQPDETVQTSPGNEGNGDTGQSVPSTPATSGHSHDGHDHSSHETPEKTGPPWPEREVPEGNWVLRTVQIRQVGTPDKPQPQIGEMPLLIVKLTPGTESEAGAVERVTGRADFEQLAVSESSIEGDDVSCTFAAPNGQTALTFQGRFVDGVIAGTMVDVNGMARFLRFVPTDERTFARLPMFVSLPMTEMEQFRKLTTSPVPEEEMKVLVKKFPSSPLHAIGTGQTLMQVCQANSELKTFEKMLQEAVDMRSIWGDRSAIIERLNGIQIAVRSGYQPEWCIEQLGELEERVKDDEALAGVAVELGRMRTECRFVLGTSLLESDDAEERSRGREIAEELLAGRPHHAVLTASLADAARLDGRKEEALNLYAELVALPMQEQQLQQLWRNDPIEHVLPSERLGKLWAEANEGSSEGLDGFIQKTYDEKLVSFELKQAEPREDVPGNRTVLIELFTGIQCPMSIAPEVAFRGLAKAFPDTTLVQLRYHVHMAGQRIGHDPLTNADTEGRYFNFYKTNLTPRIFLDGTVVQGADGLMPEAETSYKDLTTLVERLLEEKSDLQIELAASQQEDTLQISCTASGIGEGEDVTEVPDTARLRLAIAESGIAFTGLNGFREHDMVVRKVIGGDLGISPSDGKLTYEGTVSLEELRTELHNYLTQYEASVSHQFTETPLDLTNLSVVAIVQESVSRKVLQCRIVRLE